MQWARRPGREPLLMAPILALAGCAEPQLEFRGYSELSSCAEIIDAELAADSVFQGGFASEDVENPGYVAELYGTIFDERVRIEIQCDVRGFISSIHYISLASDPEDTGEVFFRFADELAGRFGEPTQIVTDDGHSLRFLCHNPTPILLEEWRLEPESDDEEPLHEVYLAVVPPAAECLEDAPDSGS
ncbi:MAG: hypothetical protein PVH89_12610, partial [Gammaproteobacteria bacterium]